MNHVGYVEQPHLPIVVSGGQKIKSLHILHSPYLSVHFARSVPFRILLRRESHSEQQIGGCLCWCKRYQQWAHTGGEWSSKCKRKSKKCRSALRRNFSGGRIA